MISLEVKFRKSSFIFKQVLATVRCLAKGFFFGMWGHTWHIKGQCLHLNGCCAIINLPKTEQHPFPNNSRGYAKD